MKLITPKLQFYGNYSTIKSIRFTSISSILRLFILFLLTFSSTFSLSFNAFAFEKNSQQVPAKKITPTTAKSASSSKIAKGKKGTKSKKSVVIKKDTLVDVDPASASSPLYNQ